MEDLPLMLSNMVAIGVKNYSHLATIPVVAMALSDLEVLLIRMAKQLWML
jgi:hypothetical protein